MKKMIILLIFLLPNILISQDTSFESFDYDSRFQSWSRFRLEAENTVDWKRLGIKGRIGAYYDSANKLGGYAQIGVRVAKGDFMKVYLFPFWLNYSFKDERYNTPVTLEVIFWDYHQLKKDLGFRLALDIDFYLDTFVPSLNIAFQPYKKKY